MKTCQHPDRSMARQYAILGGCALVIVGFASFWGAKTVGVWAVKQPWRFCKWGRGWIDEFKPGRELP